MLFRVLFEGLLGLHRSGLDHRIKTLSSIISFSRILCQLYGSLFEAEIVDLIDCQLVSLSADQNAVHGSHFADLSSLINIDSYYAELRLYLSNYSTHDAARVYSNADTGPPTISQCDSCHEGFGFAGKFNNSD